MKKLFTTVAFVLSSMSLMAKDYSGNLEISINGETASQESSISVDEQNNGKYTLTLKNFNLGGEYPVGTIQVKDVEATTIDGAKVLSFKDTNTILQNDDNNAEMEGQSVPLDITGFINDYGFNTNISIDLGEMQVDVKFTPNSVEGTQIPNSDFEDFHTATHTTNGTKYTSQEADHWHSFSSGERATSGFFVGTLELALQGEQSFESTATRTSTSKKCLLIKSRSVAWKSANGTVTTGRMFAGSMTPTDPKNHAYLDMSNSATDDKGDPFYTTLSKTPDAISVWVKFKQGDSGLAYKYASINAVITDGTYYQDPEAKNTTYKNKVAVAANTKIESKDFTWQQITAPFDYKTYANNKAKAKAILVTLSTNAQPGGGSKNTPDELYIDDLSLVYNAGLKSVEFNKEDIKDKSVIYTDEAVTEASFDVTSDGQGAFVNKKIVEDENGKKLVITISAQDFSKINRYEIAIKPATDKFTTMDYGYATYTSNIPVAYPTAEGVKAYTVSCDGSKVTYNEVKGTVAANTPLLLRAENKGAATYTLPYSDASAITLESNSLNESDGTVKGDGTIYVLFNGSKGVGFYRLSNGSEIPAKKCYLQLSNANAKPSFFAIDNETTGINHIENATESVNDEPMFNLAGQKVNNNYKGIVVVNGKKMINK